MQQLFSTLAAHTSSMGSISPSLSSHSEETPEVGTSTGKELLVSNDDNEGWCRNQLNGALLSQSLLNPNLFFNLDTHEEDNKGTPKWKSSEARVDQMVPNTDKEGWCRNKKYIEKTETGFMCLVCKKVYGRYNSVSYHVTIYHRNPPIKCDIESCDFTTREARYIHFHKYYRHGIPLPRSIDQGSRRCTFCKHVSKSPAMLEKHMKRHTDGHPLSTRKKRSESTCEPMMENYEVRSRTLSECPVPTLEMIMEECIKPRSFTL